MAIDGIGSASSVTALYQSARPDKPSQGTQVSSSNDFGAAVSISISEEARAFLSAASSGSLTGSGSLASGLSRELTGVVEGVGEAVEIALEDDLEFDERVSILAAGEVFAKDIEAIFNEFSGKPLTASSTDDFLERVAQAEDDFFGVFEGTYGDDMSEGQAGFFDESMDELEALFEELEEGLGGRTLSASEDALISKADGVFYDALDKIISKDREPNAADARLIDETLAGLSKAIQQVLAGKA